jgi:hypothetical protein
MHEATSGNVDREELSDMANEDKAFRLLISHDNLKDSDRVNNVFEPDTPQRDNLKPCDFVCPGSNFFSTK